jgi:hypothetical protein
MCYKSQKGYLYVSTQDRLLTVSEVAGLLRVKASWVYDHADDLGAFRLGKYVRFSLPRLMHRLERAESLGSQPNDLH